MTKNKNEFIIFQLIRSKINLAVGSAARCKGIGAVITKLTPTKPPILFTPVYYCLTAKISTISQAAIKFYNKYIDVTIKINKSLIFQQSIQDSHHDFKVAVHNSLDYVGLPILHLSTDAIKSPSLASLTRISAPTVCSPRHK